MLAWTCEDGTPLDAPAMIAGRLLATPEPVRGPRVLAIDGPAGSGKTTLAAAVVTAMASAPGPDTGPRPGGAAGPPGPADAVVLHMDDFYEGWSGLGDATLSRVQAQVLEPLSLGRPARWQRYDWVTGAFAEWHDVPDVAVVVLEGCGSGSTTVRAYPSLLVWIEADIVERLRRGLDRDGAAVEAQWRDWMRREDAHFAEHRTRERADLRLRSTDP
jgi:uridine kinase